MVGTLEPGFLRNARAWADGLAAVGDDTVFFERVAGHDFVQRRAVFPSVYSGYWDSACRILPITPKPSAP